MRVIHQSTLRCLLPFALGALAIAASGARVAVRQPSAAAQWFKGNTHTHTTESDGDSAPEDVARWYRDHGYNFLVLSDHNVLTSIEPPAATPAADKTAAQPFILIKGEEVSDRFQGKAVHLNALGIAAKIDPQGGESFVSVLQRNVDAIRRGNGVPHINHPNFNWAFSTAELQQVRNNRLLEIFNGHPQVNNLGGGGVPGLEQVWDAILSSGTMIYGIAVDDAHHFKQPGNPAAAGPGRGWVMVRADRLDGGAILQALDAGQFYASTGVELSEYSVTARAMTIAIKQDAWAKYRVQFVGKGGRLLHEAVESPAEYVFRGDEGYVRAKILESNGRLAWTQPIWIK
jgi:hypothetical protein